MKIILNIEDDATIPNGKLVEMEAIYGGSRRLLREIIPSSCALLSKEQTKDALATRLKQLVSTEIENYVNSKF